MIFITKNPEKVQHCYLIVGDSIFFKIKSLLHFESYLNMKVFLKAVLLINVEQSKVIYNFYLL